MANKKQHKPVNRSPGTKDPRPASTNPESPITKTLIYTALIAFVALWWYAATLEWRAEREAERILSGEVSPENFTRIPLAAEPQRRAAQVLMASGSPDYDYIDALLADAVDKRPLYAPYWLDRAKAAYRAGRSGDAGRYNARAVKLWPTRPILLWKAAMLYAQLGDTGAALDTLRRYLYASPGGTDRVVTVASRLQPEPAAMLAAVLPERFVQTLSRDDVVWRILRQARRFDDTALGQAAWRELTRPARREPGKARYYTEWMVALDKQPEALAAWRAVRPQAAPGRLDNGGFEAPLMGGLGWRAWDRAGVTLVRDDQHSAYAGQYSLKAVFSGEQNTHFYHLRQYLPVEPAATYTLSYAWRGRDLTTRSGPYISVRARKAGRLARSEDRWGSWAWERRRISFTAPAEEHFVEVRLRRNRTDALDHKIAGELWLDDFSLTRSPVLQGREKRAQLRLPRESTNQRHSHAIWQSTTQSLPPSAWQSTTQSLPPSAWQSTNQSLPPSAWQSTNQSLPPSAWQSTNQSHPLSLRERARVRATRVRAANSPDPTSKDRKT